MIEKATLGAGCFWCIEACFKDIDGIIKLEPGYAGGHTNKPTYEEVCKGTTGHAEVLHIEFDNSIIQFSEILKMFWFVHDPTQLNRQGNDIGNQYRSVIFYHNEAQLKTAEIYINELTQAKIWEDPIVTEIAPFNNYYSAEDYHKNYFELNPENTYCQFVVKPKVEKFNQVFKKVVE